MSELVLQHYIEPTENASIHYFVLNKLGVSPRKLKDAKVVRVTNMPDIKSTLKGSDFILPYAILETHEKGLKYNSFYPYPKNRDENCIPKEGKRGLGAIFDSKVYGHLLTFYSGNIKVLHENMSESRKRMLRNAGLDPDETYTLQAHFDAFKRLAEANRAKNEG